MLALFMTPLFDVAVLSGSFIRVLSKYIGRSVGYTLEYPFRREHSAQFGSDAPGSSTEVIRALGSRMLEMGLKNGEVPLELWRPQNGDVARIVCGCSETASFVLTKICAVLCLRESEILRGLVLLERMVSGGLSDIVFSLSEENLPMALVVAMMLANKTSADKPYSNQAWAELFEIDISLLNESEMFFLKCISFDAGVSEAEFGAVSSLWRKIISPG